MELWERLEQAIATDMTPILGFYDIPTASGNVEKPAIWIYPPQLKSDRSVSGLEVIIQRTPQASRKHLSGEIKRTKEMVIRLIHHDESGGLEEAVDWLSELVTNISGFVSVRSRIMPQTDIADEQATVTATFIERAKPV